MSVKSRLWTLLHARRAPYLLAALALLLSAPSLGGGLYMDDHAAANAVTRRAHPFEMFQVRGDVMALERERGGLVWWSSPELSIRFLRPLSSLTHFIDFTFWPRAAWAMHLWNCLLYAALVVVAALLYRRLLGAAPAAGLAGLMFAVDEMHASAIGWISSRNTVLATLLALLALLAHVAARERRSTWLLLVSAGCSGLALLAGEYALCALAYLPAYALVLERGPLQARLLALGPHAVVGAAWAAVYVAGGYGLRGSGWYRHPFEEPIDALLQGVADLPLWIFSQLGLNFADLAVPPSPVPWRALALFALFPLLALLLPVLRANREARFFAAGMLLSILPLFTTQPQSRLLLAASFGAFGWIASALYEAAAAVRQGLAARVGGRTLRVLHLLAAPLLFVPGLSSLSGMDAAARALAASAPRAETAHVVIVNVPQELLTMTARMVRERSGDAGPASLHTLYAGASPLSVTRVDERTLDVTVESGWGSLPFERTFASRRSMPGRGSVRSTAQLRATVLEVGEHGLPTRVRFVFPSALESRERTWLRWDGKRPTSWRPPALGQRVSVPAASFWAIAQP